MTAVQQELSQYSKALSQMKVEEVKRLRGRYSNSATVALADVNLDSYFQILLMSEVCEALLHILQHRTPRSLFLTHSLQIQRADSLKEMINLFMQDPEGYKRMEKGSKIGLYLIIAVLGAFTLYCLFYLAAALVAAQFTLQTLFLGAAVAFGVVAIRMGVEAMNKVMRFLNLIQSVYQESEPKALFSKKFLNAQGITTPCTQSPYELAQGFFANKDGSDRSLAVETYAAYRANCSLTD
ncbi:MAG: hypothetical protein KBB94_07630 [Legionellaceae bacterium]|nr:hypothetical protein [Legionellaceae bacterium]MBP9775709.1 hypothetical protein [Legionellaceae bacterium]